MRVLCVTMVLYAVVMGAVVLARPRAVYDAKRRRYKPFGTGGGARTLVPLWAVGVLAAVILYVAVSVAATIASPAASALTRLFAPPEVPSYPPPIVYPSSRIWG